ncbi:hypothetical protein Hanom_Chr13g01228261 [Helianthus anomalus]
MGSDHIRPHTPSHCHVAADTVSGTRCNPFVLHTRHHHVRKGSNRKIRNREMVEVSHGEHACHLRSRHVGPTTVCFVIRL